MSGDSKSAAAFGLTALTLTAAYPWIPDKGITAGIAALIGVGACVALFVGPRLNRARDPRAWRYLGGASLVFIIGLVVHPWSSTLDGPLPLLGEGWTLAGYLLLLSTHLHWLRASRALDRSAVIDGLIVATGTLAPVIQHLAVPALLTNGSRSPVLSWVVALYPVFDVVIVFMVANLTFSTAVSIPAFRLVALAMASMLVGDLSYALLAAQGSIEGSQQMDVPYMLAFTSIGTAALHPSMARMSDVIARPVQPWSFARLSLILPSVAAPFVTLGIAAKPGAVPLAVVLLAAGVVAAVLARAVSAVDRLAKSQTRLAHQATHDTLTGLANRESLRQFVDVQIYALHGAQPWVVYIDLDDFKMINDHWGHELGDQLLMIAARRLEHVVVKPCVVARTGGDEFGIAGVGTSDDAARMAAEVLRVFRTPFPIGDLELVVTASAGLVTVTDQRSADMLLRDADVAMYRSKDGGRNRITVFEPSMREQVQRRVETELALRRAVVEDQLWVAFQPLINMADGHTIGAEALIRWDAPAGLSGSPADFIGIAEETGLIHDIGILALTSALDELARWRVAGLVDDSFSMHVNLSVHQLSDSSLPDTVICLLGERNIPAACLTLEVTESGLMSDPEHGRSILSALRAAGVQLAVDDFGTGYSSLSYLSTLPITDLKIDRSFVVRLASGGEAIIAAVVALACSLSLRVTAEGVETRAQQGTLLRLGLDKGQGWLWGKAVPASEFARKHLAQPASVGGTS